MYERTGLGMTYTDPQTGHSIWKRGFHHTEASLKAELLKDRPAAKAAPARKAAPAAKPNADLQALFEQLVKP